MRERNVLKTIEENEVPSARQMTVGEINQLYEMSKGKGDWFYMVSNAFDFGYAVGHRSGLRDAKKK